MSSSVLKAEVTFCTLHILVGLRLNWTGPCPRIHGEASVDLHSVTLLVVGHFQVTYDLSHHNDSH